MKRRDLFRAGLVAGRRFGLRQPTRQSGEQRRESTDASRYRQYSHGLSDFERCDDD